MPFIPRLSKASKSATAFCSYHDTISDRGKPFTFIVKDKVRHVLIMGLESTETAVRWNNKLQALAENVGFGSPANNSSDPRHSAGSTAEYMGVTGEPISKWANAIGLSAAFDPDAVKEFG